MKHYKSKKNPNYPSTACGKNLVSMDYTDNYEDVTCKTCIKSVEREIKSKDGV